MRAVHGYTYSLSELSCTAGGSPPGLYALWRRAAHWGVVRAFRRARQNAHANANTGAQTPTQPSDAVAATRAAARYQAGAVPGA